MSTGYGNDKDNDDNRHDEDVDSTDFTTTWKIYLFIYSSVGRGPRNEGPELYSRAKGWRPRKNKTLVKPMQ